MCVAFWIFFISIFFNSMRSFLLLRIKQLVICFYLYLWKLNWIGKIISIWVKICRQIKFKLVISIVLIQLKWSQRKVFEAIKKNCSFIAVKKNKTFSLLFINKMQNKELTFTKFSAFFLTILLLFKFDSIFTLLAYA